MVQADSVPSDGVEKSGDQISGCLYAVDFEPEGEPGFFIMEILVPATKRAFYPGPVTVSFADRTDEAKSEDSA